MPERFKDMIVNSRLCPICNADFFGPGPRFTIHGGPALPRPEEANLSFLHYDCHHDHSETCERHANCTAGRDEAIARGKVGWTNRELAENDTVTKPRVTRKRRIVIASTAAKTKRKTTAKEADNKIGDGDAASSVGAGAGAGAGPAPQKKIKRTPEELAAFIDAESLGPRFRGSGSGSGRLDTFTLTAAAAAAAAVATTTSAPAPSNTGHSSVAPAPGNPISRANASISNTNTTASNTMSLTSSTIDSGTQVEGQGQDDDDEDIYN
ncbi:hypothetical protein F5X99DRAFT_401526 [Biscogniauxia marginata]|nr:hypothetical protein F5X99DRAFT_401526 [Biscogniauxia marginata]